MPWVATTIAATRAPQGAAVRALRRSAPRLSRIRASHPDGRELALRIAVGASLLPAHLVEELVEGGEQVAGDLSSKLLVVLRPKDFLGLQVGYGANLDVAKCLPLAGGLDGKASEPSFVAIEGLLNALAKRWVDGRGWKPLLARLAEADFERKLQAVRCYRSQISTFWADEAALAAALRDHAMAVAGGVGLAERVWYNPAPSG